MDFQQITGLLWCFIQGLCAIVVRDSVVFNKISNIYTSQSSWKLTLVEDLESYNPNIVVANNQIHELYEGLNTVYRRIHKNVDRQWTRNFNGLLTDFKILKNDFDDLKNEYDDIRKLERSDKRLRVQRSLLPFVGSLTSLLFGTVSEMDLETVKRNLATISDKQQTLTHVLNESLSLMKISRQDIKENRDKLNLAIHELSRDLQIIKTE